jgi:hypothetical protein
VAVEDPAVGDLGALAVAVAPVLAVGLAATLAEAAASAAFLTDTW